MCFRATKIRLRRFLRPLQTTLLCEAIPFGLLPVRVAFRTQMQTLQQSAAKGRLTLSEYARQMVLAGKVIAPTSPEELGLVAELTREKNNLNQLAKVQNAAGAATREAELIRIIRFYNRVIAKLKRE